MYHSIRSSILRKSCYSCSDSFPAPSAPSFASVDQSTALSLVGRSSTSLTKLNEPKWHPPYKLYKVLASHAGVVNSVCMDPSNEFFSTGSGDCTIKLWDLASGKVKLTLTSHSSPVRALTTDARWPYLFSSSDDKQIFVHDLASLNNAKVRSFFGHSSTVTHLTLHPTLPILFSGGRDKSIKVWDIRSPKPVLSLTGHLDSIAGIAAESAEPQLITSSFDFTIKLWDLKMARCISTLTHHSKPPRIAIHPVHYSFASADSTVVKTWRLPEGKLLNNVRDHSGSVINKIVLSDDDVMIGATNDGRLFCWDYLSGHNFQQINVDFPGSSLGETTIKDIVFDQSQSRLIAGCGDHTVKLFKIDDGVEPTVIDWTPPEEEVWF
ncbi:hypothetical protein GEMRC1_007003 [Eukaryota sp. GEM-RC1]